MPVPMKFGGIGHLCYRRKYEYEYNDWEGACHFGYHRELMQS